MKIQGLILATFEHPNSEFWGFQEGIQDRADYEGVWASILERFSKAWERDRLLREAAWTIDRHHFNL